MKNSGVKKILSMLLVCLMLFSSMPFAAINAQEVYPKMQVFNAASGADFHQYKYYKNVYTVTFLDSMDSSAIAGALESWDISAAKDGSVISWIYLNDEATAAAGANRYDVYIAGEGGVAAHENTVYLFYMFESLKEVNGVEHLHTGAVKSFYGWFYGCIWLESIDLSSLDTSSVTTLENMFARCYSLEAVNLSGWDTSKVISMKGVFDMSPPNGISPDYSLKSVDLSGWDTSNVTTMENMFRNCEALTELDLSSFNTAKVTNIRYMFYYCKHLKNIYVGEGWTTESIEKINDGVFNCCYALIGGTDDQAENELIYNNKFQGTYAPGAGYANIGEQGFLDDISNKPVTPEYKVTYEFIGDVPDGVTVPAQAVYEEGTLVSIEADFSAEHYIFSGWSTEDATVTDGEFTINNDVHFVGSWTKLYKVEYKYDDKSDDEYNASDEATGIPDVELWFAPGEDVPVYGIPYADGYVFVGWNTEDADVVGDSFIMPENNVVFYGFFKKPVESVEFLEEDFELDVDDEDGKKLYVLVKPEDATIKEIVYVSSDESVVTVNKDGIVVPVGEGTATITVFSKDDTSKSDTVTVTVRTFVKDIKVEKTEYELNVDDTDEIKVIIKPDDATNQEVTYESSDEAVVMVDENGKITAVGDGTATITVTSKDNKDVKEVITVTVKTPVTKITATEDFTLEIGEEKNLDASVNEDATNKELIYETDNSSVVKVDGYGNAIAVGEGTATITITSKDNPDVKKTVIVTVKIPVEDISTEEEKYELNVGESEEIKVTVTPGNATNKEVTYKSSDETVVTVDENGKIAAVGEGTATITVASVDNPEIKEIITVTVKVPVEDITTEKEKYELNVGETEEIKVTVTPANATNKEVIYKSSDETVVTVDENGKIIAVGEGTAIVTVISKDDITKKATITVTVTIPEEPTTEEPTTEEPTTEEPTTEEPSTEEPTTEESTTEEPSTEEPTTEESTTEESTTEEPTTGEPTTEESTTEESTTEESTTEESTTEEFTTEESTTEESTTEEPTTEEPSTDEPTTDEPVTDKPETDEPEVPEYIIDIPESITVMIGQKLNVGISIYPDDGMLAPVYSSSDDRVVKVDADGNILGIGVGTADITVDFGNGEVRVIPVTVIALPVNSPKQYICFGKTDGIGWYEVSINGGDFFAQGPNSTLEVTEGSVLVIRVQDMWIDDEFDFYVNGKKMKVDAANTITVVVDGYMLIGALSMDVEVPDVEESLTFFEKIAQAIKAFFDWLANLFK